MTRINRVEDPLARRSPTPIKVDRIQSLDALPEVKYFYAVADHGGQEPRAQVTSRINGVAYRHELSGLLKRFQESEINKRKHTSLHSQRSTNAEDHDKKDEGGETGRRRPVSRITHGAYNDEQHGGPKELKNI